MEHSFSEPIAASELIITERGAIYHLDLAPEHLAPTVITVGDPGRVGEVSRHFDEVTHTAHHREFVTHTGRIGEKQITVTSTGIGPDNIDIVLNELDALVNIDFSTRTIREHKTSLNIIRLGTCGALQADIPVDSLVVATHGIGLDNLMLYYLQSNSPEEEQLLREFRTHTNLGDTIHPYIAGASAALLPYFGAGYTQGVTVTCPGFYGPQGRLLRLPLAFPHLQPALTSFKYRNSRIVNFEMETSAIYGLGQLLGHKCLSINTVVANRVTKSFSKDHRSAVGHMIAKSLEIIAGLP